MTTPAAIQIPLSTRRRLTEWQLFCYVVACALLLVLSLIWLRVESKIGYSAFGGYQSSGKAAAAGLNPYALYPDTYRFSFGNHTVSDVNFNPPCLLPLLQALSHLSRPAFAWTWTAASFLAFALTAWILLRVRSSMHPLQVAWLLLNFPVLNTLTSGQIYGLLVLLAALAYCFHQRNRPIAAAIAVGLLVACKPTMAFLLPFLWLARNRREASVATAVTCIASALPILLYGPAIYPRWINALGGDMHWLLPTDIAPIAILRRHGHLHAGYFLAAAIALALGWWQWKRRPGFGNSCGAGICAGILCAPLAWHTYIFIAAPFYVTRRWPSRAILGACLLLIPFGLAPSAISGLYLAAIALFLYSFLSADPVDHLVASGAAVESWDVRVRVPI